MENNKNALESLLKLVTTSILLGKSVEGGNTSFPDGMHDSFSQNPEPLLRKKKEGITDKDLRLY